MANLKEIQKFIKEVSETDVFKVEVKTADLELFIQTKPDNKIAENVPSQFYQQLPVTNPQVQNSPITSDNKKKEVTDSQVSDNIKIIKSPIVGTFYRKPAPSKPSFVNVGDSINKGQVICIVEAMKLFNEIEAEISGTIDKILVEDATPVEFDQPLFQVKVSK